ncbi:OLC1v1006045C1 [Oldenlandia corymbosa var. corymbosa]|uniref:OLC1v1006045C1 n=1 Tax=Oldenlandia corymbosa var. corymbosa TaxID=529605 RepID=A0AAV1DJ19_OLDCO|nr:OLC1v1006045C1 [Oldenlandia corymbosa var. corymbosa]
MKATARAATTLTMAEKKPSRKVPFFVKPPEFIETLGSYNSKGEWIPFPLVMSSGNAGSGLYDDSNPFNVVNSDDDTSTTKSVVEKIKKKKKKRVVARESEKGPSTKKSKTDVSSSKQIEATKLGKKTIASLTEKETPTEKETGPNTQPSSVEKGKGPFEGNVTILLSEIPAGAPSVAVHTFDNPPTIECPVLEEFAANLTEADGLKLENPKKDMYEALVWGLCKLSTDQLPLWEPLCAALSKISAPEKIVSFPGDVAVVFTRGLGEELAIPEVFNEYFGIDLKEDEDETAEEDDTSNSGAKDQDPPVMGDTGVAKEKDPPVEGTSENYPGNASRSQTAESYFVHQVHMMILDENQARNFPIYAMVSTAMRKLENIHNISVVRTLEKDIVDAVQAYNVQIHSRLVQRFKQKEEEYQRRLQQYDLDYQDSLVLEANVNEDMANLQQENARQAS